jgi:hypothetical protein
MTEKEAADLERYNLVNQAVKAHESNIEAEQKRFRAELDQIDATYELRLSSASPPVPSQAGGLEWHKGRHPWSEHDGYPRHQHSVNGALTIAPGDTRLHFKGSAFDQPGYPARLPVEQADARRRGDI